MLGSGDEMERLLIRDVAYPASILMGPNCLASCIQVTATTAGRTVIEYSAITQHLSTYFEDPPSSRPWEVGSARTTK